ncbi:alpha-ketoglutarate permease [Paenibacillus sp. BIHB 4019]|uniref:Alpha-ketoglutarate permease n=1 Tax=Paenibacillus sp. BIHB 4019 TaxID=1870819 RepID=A0A1B2DCT2_9BACL|nr:MFS transporter [Paenibacillus sp. BIHB 4019]ANY65495.1 alpha-ketoglutarate permease [Paenibacillus sp. BIHB 4019]
MEKLTDKHTFLDKIGIPSNLIWGFIGIIIFMIGEGLEQGWLSPYLIERGVTIENSSLMFSVYGIATAIAAWLSGVFVQTIGPKKTMLVGLIMFIIGTILFIGLGIGPLNFHVMLLTYLVRGLGYPLFAFGFLTWVTYSTGQNKLASAMGWFYFVMSLGMNVVGPFIAGYTIPVIGNIQTLWLSLFFVTLGGIVAIALNRAKFDLSKVSSGNKKEELLKGITILYRKPKVSLGVLVKIINPVAVFGFAIFLPTYLVDYGFSTSEWLQLYSAMFMVAIIFNVVFGFLSDKIGWRTTIAWFGGVGSAIATLIVYYTPQVFGHNYTMMLIAVCLSGATLAGYVPLSALLPSLAPKDKGAAMSALNLGSGLSSFLAPALVGSLIRIIGTNGVVFVFVILYLVGAVITAFLKLPNETVNDGDIKQTASV